MPDSLTDRLWRQRHGWSDEPVDDCWLDCDAPGYHKVWYGQEIVLCCADARALEEGRFGRSYWGAPLPADSVAVEWPWRQVARVRVDPVPAA